MISLIFNLSILKFYHPLKNVLLVIKVVEQLCVLGIYVLYAYH